MPSRRSAAIAVLAGTVAAAAGATFRADDRGGGGCRPGSRAVTAVVAEARHELVARDRARGSAAARARIAADRERAVTAEVLKRLPALADVSREQWSSRCVPGNAPRG